MMEIYGVFNSVLELDMIEAPNRCRGPCRWSTLNDNSKIPTCDFILNSQLNSSERIKRSIAYAQEGLARATSNILENYKNYQVPGDGYDIQLKKIVDIYQFYNIDAPYAEQLVPFDNIMGIITKTDVV